MPILVNQPQTASGAILAELVSEMSDNDANFAMLCGSNADPFDTSSDIDLIFGQDPRLVVEPILKRMETLEKILVIQRLHYEVPHGYYYVIYMLGCDSEFLHLDCLYDPWGIGRYYLSTGYLLEGRVTESWGCRASRQRELLYFLIKRAVKGRASATELQSLRRAILGSDRVFWREVQSLLGSKAGVLVDRLCSAGGEHEISDALSDIRDVLERRFRFKHPLRYLTRLALTCVRWSRRLFRPTGLFVVLVGPDGSGKSTISAIAASRLERAFRRVRRFHWRPGLLRKLRATTDATGRHLPPRTSEYGGIISFARFIYYWFDFVIGYWVVIRPTVARTGFVIGERYFHDVLVAPARYGFAVPQRLMRLAARLVPSPDLTILLESEPQLIRRRKAELTECQIASLIRRYKDEIQYWGRHITVSTDSDPTDVASLVSNLVLKERAKKTAKQIGWAE